MKVTAPQISVIGNGLIANAISKTFKNVTLYSRDSDPTQFVHDILIVAAPCGRRFVVEQDPKKDLLDCSKVVDTVSKCVYNKLIHISSQDVLDATVYGKNRKWIEEQILQFSNSVSLRIGKALAAGLERNVLSDIATAQWLDKINLNSNYQWYPIHRILHDSNSLFASGKNVDVFLSRPISNNEIVTKYKPELINRLVQNTVPAVQRNAKNSAGIYVVPDLDVWKIFDTYFIDNRT